MLAVEHRSWKTWRALSLGSCASTSASFFFFLVMSDSDATGHEGEPESGPGMAAFTAEQLALIDQLIAAWFSGSTEPPQSDVAGVPSSLPATGKSSFPPPLGCCSGRVQCMIVTCLFDTELSPLATTLGREQCSPVGCRRTTQCGRVCVKAMVCGASTW